MRAVTSSVRASGTFHSSNCHCPRIKPETSPINSICPAGGRNANRASIAARACNASSRAVMILSSTCSCSAICLSTCQIEIFSATTPTSSAINTAVAMPAAANAK